jgi:DNA-binding GntR family transcriptional regulator
MDQVIAGETSRMNTSDWVASCLREMVIKGTYRPGDHLVDQHVAEMFHVSRHTARDAMKRLETDGILTARRNRGYIVRVLHTDDVHSIFAARRVVELAGITAAARGPHPATALHEALTAVEETLVPLHPDQILIANLEFHRTVAQYNDSPLIDTFFSTVLAQMRLLLSTQPRSDAFHVGYTERKRSIVAAVDAGDADAAADLLRDYLDHSERGTAEYVPPAPAF